MDKAIFISIKPIHLNKIVSGIKNYEFRNYIPKKDINKLYVYESYPTCSLKYILTIDKIVKYPDKIKEKGYGNSDFNKGIKTKYAYHIKKVEKLKESINLKDLKSKYNFNPPQRYAYDTKYPKITELIKK